MVGHAFSVIFTPFANYAADRYGKVIEIFPNHRKSILDVNISITESRRRTVCCISLFMFSVSCVLKAINDYSTLVISSIMASCSSLLVFSSSQAWYNHEHIENHDFPIEWISETLDKVGFWSGVLSVIAGVIAYFLAEIIVSSPSGTYSKYDKCI